MSSSTWSRCSRPERDHPTVGGDVGSVTGSVNLVGCQWLRYDYGPALMARDRPASFTMWRYRNCCRFPTVR